MHLPVMHPFFYFLIDRPPRGSPKRLDNRIDHPSRGFASIQQIELLGKIPKCRNVTWKGRGGAHAAEAAQDLPFLRDRLPAMCH